MQFSWESQGATKRLDLTLECDVQTGRTKLHDKKSGQSQDFDSYDEAITALSEQQPQSQN